MIATLPMYDWPTQSIHWDQLWTHIRDAFRTRGLPAPDALSRGGNLWEYWENPDLILGQTCGLPYRARLHDKVTLLGALDHGLPGAAPGYYTSVLVTQHDTPGAFPDFKGKVLAYNDSLSQSGWAAPHAHAARHGFAFSRTHHTGAHADSARAVAERRADIAAIDAETWRLVQQILPDIARRLRVVDRTQPSPGLPLITSHAIDPNVARDAVEAGLAATDTATLKALHIQGFVRISAEAYRSVPMPPAPQDAHPAFR